jgi:hypothetical protein
LLYLLYNSVASTTQTDKEEMKKIISSVIRITLDRNVKIILRKKFNKENLRLILVHIRTIEMIVFQVTLTTFEASSIF